MRLLDVNVLLANSLELHEHHLAVRRWFQQNPTLPFATCAITEASFLRLLMNPVINGNPIDVETGIALLRQLHRHPQHRFLEPLPGPSDTVLAGYLARVQGYRRVTDAYLVGLALANVGKLATFDKKLAELFGPDGIEVIGTT